MTNKINPKHIAQKNRLIKIAKLFLVVGGIILVTGIYLVSNHEPFREYNVLSGTTKHTFVAIGIFSLFIAGNLLFFANAGAILRFKAQEMAPVGADTLNFLGKKAKPGIQEVAGAIASGFKQEKEDVPIDIRLSKLKDLLDKGLISQKEYEEKRVEILEDL